MKSTSIGCSIVRLSDQNVRQLVEYKSILDSELLEGRQCLFIWEAGMLGDEHPPFEKLILNFFLGDTETRSSKDDWVYFGNGAVRTYGKDNRLDKTLFWLILLKNGKKAYTRIGSISPSVLEASKIPVEDHSFTRDVANNVWHLRSNRYWSSIISRFKNLAAWSDEKILVIAPETIQRRFLPKLNLSQVDIPKVDKVLIPDRLN